MFTFEHEDVSGVTFVIICGVTSYSCFIKKINDIIEINYIIFE